ncbi:DUF1203 domain-containing protein [Curvivirga sp.]|uniref:DUF1203 domain-containing protein n=1 Tax=Curvivirga sp. TaxID=2856848 RepID=UPI003B599A4E
MANIQFTSMPTKDAEHYWNGGLDAYGQKPQSGISDGSGLPCRHCQQDIEEGEEFFLLAYKPFEKDQPFTETGPIFLHKHACTRYPETSATPEMFLKRESYLVKGYKEDDSIFYGTGKIIPPSEIENYAKEILSNEDVSYLHIRSATNGCFSCRIDRA